MTRKDYELIAEVIKNVVVKHKCFSPRPKQSIEAIKVTAIHLAHGFAKENSRFDNERFITACGLSTKE